MLTKIFSLQKKEIITKVVLKWAKKEQKSTP